MWQTDNHFVRWWYQPPRVSLILYKIKATVNSLVIQAQQENYSVVSGSISCNVWEVSVCVCVYMQRCSTHKQGFDGNCYYRNAERKWRWFIQTHTNTLHYAAVSQAPDSETRIRSVIGQGCLGNHLRARSKTSGYRLLWVSEEQSAGLLPRISTCCFALLWFIARNCCSAPDLVRRGYLH